MTAMTAEAKRMALLGLDNVRDLILNGDYLEAVELVGKLKTGIELTKEVADGVESRCV